MKYILLILYRVIKFIFFGMLYILAKTWSIIWNLKYNIPSTPFVIVFREDKYKEYYKSFWDIAVGRVSFVYWGNCSRRSYTHGRRDYKDMTGYVTVKGRTKLFTYKV